MFPELRDEIEFEIGEMKEQFAFFSELLVKIQVSQPSEIELIAFGSLLQAFYMGVENIFKRICFHSNEILPQGDAWHIELLERMSSPGANRPAVISESLFNSLRGYLGFRHLYRNLYTFRLNWTRMEKLVMKSEIIFHQLEQELMQFLSKMENENR